MPYIKIYRNLILLFFRTNVSSFIGPLAIFLLDEQTFMQRIETYLNFTDSICIHREFKTITLMSLRCLHLARCLSWLYNYPVVFVLESILKLKRQQQLHKVKKNNVL